MTQYLLAVYGGEDTSDMTEEEVQKAYADVEVFNQKLQANGAWVFAGGLHEPSTATVVEAKKGEYIVTDGPFAETKEQIGGFWVIEAADLDVALELAKEASAACANPVEVRPFQSE
jgi:hypothetical protein